MIHLFALEEKQAEAFRAIYAVMVIAKKERSDGPA